MVDAVATPRTPKPRMVRHSSRSTCQRPRSAHAAGPASSRAATERRTRIADPGDHPAASSGLTTGPLVAKATAATRPATMPAERFDAMVVGIAALLSGMSWVKSVTLVTASRGHRQESKWFSHLTPR